MRRLAAIAVLAALLMGGAAPAFGAQAAAPRVVLVWLDGTKLEDWLAAPGLAEVMEESSLAIASTRTAREVAEMRAMRSSAAVTLAAGVRAAGERGTGAPLDRSPAAATVLGASLASAGIVPLVVGDADRVDAADRSASAIVATEEGPPTTTVPSVVDPIAPGGRRADIAALTEAVLASDARFVVVDPGDPARAQQAALGDAVEADRLIALTMPAMGELVLSLRRGLEDQDVLMVVAGAPSVERQARGLRLGPVAISGGDFAPGLLSSPTTRRQGVVSLVDLTPTLADALGIRLVAGGDGRNVSVHPRADAPRALTELTSAVVASALARFPLTRRMLYASMGATALAAMLFLAGIGRARGTRVAPKGGRDLVAFLVLAAASMPLGLYLVGAFGTLGVLSTTIAVASFSLGLALLTRAAFGSLGGLGAVGLITLVVICGDIAFGTPLGYRSPLSFQVAIGGRFFGVDEGVLGVAVGAGLIGSGVLLDRTLGDKRMRALAIVLLVGAVFFLGAPEFGSKFGATYTAVPAFGAFAVLAGGARVRIRHVAAVGAATVAIGALFILADKIGPGTESHVARAFEGSTDIGALISRKLSSTWRITTTTLWSGATLVYAAVIVAPILLKRDALARALWGKPHLRAALWACGVGAAAGIVANDGGVITAAPTLLFAASAAAIAMAEG